MQQKETTGRGNDRVVLNRNSNRLLAERSISRALLIDLARPCSGYPSQTLFLLKSSEIVLSNLDVFADFVLELFALPMVVFAVLGDSSYGGFCAFILSSRPQMRPPNARLA